jgi:hypothetical protein
MSALLPTADILIADINVCYVPYADIEGSGRARAFVDIDANFLAHLDPDTR